MTKISHFWTIISLKSVGQSWSNFMCSIIGVGERLHKVLGQIGSKLWFPWQQKAPIDLKWGKWCLHLFSVVFDPGLFTFEWFALIAENTSFDLGTLDSGKRSLPFGILFEMRFDLGTLDSGEQLLPFELYLFEMRIDLGILDSGERSVPFGLYLFWGIMAELSLNYHQIPSLSVPLFSHDVAHFVS